MATDKKTRILLVDDEPLAIELTQRILSKDGYDLLTADSAEEAQVVIEREHQWLSAIVLDWKMPGMSGIDLLRWIKKQDELEQIPVVMQTGLMSPNHIREGIEAGAFYYLSKPADNEVLRSVVRSAVSDFEYKMSLLRQLEQCENPLLLLQEGTFRLKTLEEAEYLSIRIANSSPCPERAVAVSELITNAVEHGNLGVSYEEKTVLMKTGTLSEELRRRQQLAENASKYVEVKVRREPRRMTVIVEDQGNGFDFQRYLQMDEDRVFHNHGRGIAIARSYLDLEYVEPGNKVIVTIPCDDGRD